MTTETIHDARGVFEGHSLDLFSTLIERRMVLKSTIEELEAEKKLLDSSVMEMLTDAGEAKVAYGDKTVSLIQSRRGTLSKERLVEAGVSAKVIADCTTYTTSTYVQVK